MSVESVAAPRHYTEADIDHNRQSYDDLTTLLAEAVDSPMTTPFEFTFDGTDLYAKDGRPLRPIFDDSLERAECVAEEHPELAFEIRRCTLDREELDTMYAMARGEVPNTLVVVADLPDEVRYATKAIPNYDIKRKPAMLRVLAWRDGKMKMFSQSLDGSDREALEAIYTYFGRKPRPGELLGQRIPIDLDTDDQLLLVHQLTGVYDASLAQQQGGEWHAGRKLEPGEHRVNSYDFVRAQHDLVQHALALHDRAELDEATIYNTVALINERLEKLKTQKQNELPHMYASPFVALQGELVAAGRRARVVGKIFSACGLPIAGGEFGVSEVSAEDQLGEAGYGNRLQPWYGKFKRNGTCVNCKEKTIVGEKSWCRSCISGHCGIKK